MTDAPVGNAANATEIRTIVLYNFPVVITIIDNMKDIHKHDILGVYGQCPFVTFDAAEDHRIGKDRIGSCAVLLIAGLRNSAL